MKLKYSLLPAKKRRGNCSRDQFNWHSAWVRKTSQKKIGIKQPKTMPGNYRNSSRKPNMWRTWQSVKNSVKNCKPWKRSWRKTSNLITTWKQSWTICLINTNPSANLTEKVLMKYLLTRLVYVLIVIFRVFEKSFSWVLLTFLPWAILVGYMSLITSLRPSGVYRGSQSRYCARILKWLLQSHVTQVKKT